MAVTMDIGMRDNIHPPEKRKVGERLACLALDKTYGLKGFESSGPLYRDIQIQSNIARLYFDHASMGFSSYGKELKGFEIAGGDRVFYPAEVRLEKEYVEVWSKEVPEPVAVRYGWEDYFDGCLFNTFGLPASSFRTHPWDE
jgi:sialate O-acetylesterase